MIRPKRLIFGHGPVIGPVRFQLVFGRLAGTGKEPKAEAELKIINDEAWAWGGPLALERSWGADFLGLAPQAGMSRAVGAGSFPTQAGTGQSPAGGWRAWADSERVAL